MRRWPFLILVFVSLLAGGTWAWQNLRTVDGRTAKAWLAFTEQASTAVSYRATGKTILHGIPATFRIAQGEQGRYMMVVTDAQGHRCALGDDGRYAWYQTGAKTVRSVSKTTAVAPVMGNQRILGTGMVAGRQVVRIRVGNGKAEKEISVDRKTGVILAMLTREQGREISRMRIRRIRYQPVTIHASPEQATTTIRSASQSEVGKRLGRAPIMPTWLPNGMRAQGRYLSWCACCGEEMVMLRYSDGLRSLSLFEKAGTHTCAMMEGCHMAPAGGDLLLSRQVGGLSIIAVGNVDKQTLEKVIASLRS